MTQEQHEATRGRQVAKAARRIVETTQRTNYQHGIISDPATGTYLTDCSGFVSLVLEGIAPVHYGAVAREVAHPYPRAFEFYDYLASQSVEAPLGWRRIERLDDVAEGDVVAWRKARVHEDDDSGHAFIVAEPPRPVAADVWAVRVYDSSDVRHFDDSRECDGIFTSGVGTGTVLIHVSPHGRPIGFQFGPEDSIHELAIVTGRLEPLTYEERPAE